jgi:hypothetical protein
MAKLGAEARWRWGTDAIYRAPWRRRRFHVLRLVLFAMAVRFAGAVR